MLDYTNFLTELKNTDYGANIFKIVNNVEPFVPDYSQLEAVPQQVFQSYSDTVLPTFSQAGIPNIETQFKQAGIADFAQEKAMKELSNELDRNTMANFLQSQADILGTSGMLKNTIEVSNKDTKRDILYDLAKKRTDWEVATATALRSNQLVEIQKAKDTNEAINQMQELEIEKTKNETAEWFRNEMLVVENTKWNTNLSYTQNMTNIQHEENIAQIEYQKTLLDQQKTENDANIALQYEYLDLSKAELEYQGKYEASLLEIDMLNYDNQANYNDAILELNNEKMEAEQEHYNALFDLQMANINSKDDLIQQLFDQSQQVYLNSALAASPTSPTSPGGGAPVQVLPQNIPQPEPLDYGFVDRPGGGAPVQVLPQQFTLTDSYGRPLDINTDNLAIANLQAAQISGRPHPITFSSNPYFNQATLSTQPLMMLSPQGFTTAQMLAGVRPTPATPQGFTTTTQPLSGVRPTPAITSWGEASYF
jgi:hypothetical protein